MRTSSPFFSVAARTVIAAAVVCFADRACGQLVQQPVDLKTYSSPSGTFTFTVDPSDIYGRGGAAYRVTKDGQEIWAKRLPFTLFEGAITDTGIAAGYGFTDGERGGEKDQAQESPGEMVVTIFDRSGSLRLKQLTKRSSERDAPTKVPVFANDRFIGMANGRPAGSSGLPFPFARGLIVDEAGDRFVVRLADDGDPEIWWTYRLSTGSLWQERPPRRWSVPNREAKLIPGTPLILLVYQQPDSKGALQIHFRLVDAEYKPVWFLHRPYEGAAIASNPDRMRLLRWINTHGRILRADQPGRWDLLLPAESGSVPASQSNAQSPKGDARVSFAVERPAGGTWSVKEVARVPFVSPGDEPKLPAKAEQPLKELGTIVLENGLTSAQSAPPHSASGRFAAMTIDNRGRFIAVDARNGSIYVFDAGGKLLSVGPNTPVAVQVESPDLAIDDKGDVFLGLEASDNANGKRPYARFSTDGQRLQDVLLPGPRCAFQHSTGNVVAVRQSEVCLINASGKVVRTIQRRADQCWLQHPRAVAVAPDGSLAVFARRLVGTETTVSLYKANGDPVATIHLLESAGGFPRLAYDGRRLVVAGDNALLIYDAVGKPLVSIEPPLEIPDGAFYHPLILPGGHELALYGGGKPVLYRFEMP